MNYIKEINAFYDWLLYNSLPTGAIALWHALMAINNKAGWADEFTVANLVLMNLTGLSRQGLDKARNILIQKGLIQYKKGSSNQAGKYRMIRFDSQKVGTEVDTIVDTEVDTKVGIDNLECKKVGTEVDTVAAQQEAQQGRSSSTLNKLNKTKTNTIITNNISMVANAFEQNGFGTINFTIKEILMSLIEQYPVEWILEAMKVAVKANIRRLDYVEGILKRWNANGGMKLEKDTAKDEYDPYAHLEVIK